VRQNETDYLRLQKELSAGKIRGSYIFTGSEDFLMDEAVDAICARLLPAEQRAAGFCRAGGREHTLEQVLDLAGTVSLFADSRLVVVPDAHYFSKEQAGNDAGMDRLLAADAEGRPGSTLVFYVPELPKNTKYLKRLASAGAVYHFPPLKQRELFDWLQRKFAVNGKAAGREALTLLVERVGRDLRRLASETDKLCTYLGNEQELDVKSVLMATARSLQGDIFALTDAVIFGRTDKALTQLQDLLASGEPPLRILAMLVRQFRLLGESLELLDRGCLPGELAARLSLHPYAAEVLARQAQQTEQSWIMTCVDLLLQADLDIKRGRVNQTLVLETLVVALGKTKKSA
jgi:DNA polymerase-3 subunit delta